MGTLWCALWGILFLVYAAHADALSQRDLGSSAAIIAVRLMVKMVWFARSAMAFVSLCQGTVL